MVRKSPKRPTDGELEILTVLWDGGPATVREVHEILSERTPTQYTTVLKLLQIMTEKGLVERDERARAHIYSARASAEETQSKLLEDLAARAFGGSVSKMVQRALSSRPATPEELEEIEDLLDQMRGKPERGGSE